jgi:hypothetical protein
MRILLLVGLCFVLTQSAPANAQTYADGVRDGLKRCPISGGGAGGGTNMNIGNWAVQEARLGTPPSGGGSFSRPDYWVFGGVSDQGALVTSGAIPIFGTLDPSDPDRLAFIFDQVGAKTGLPEGKATYYVVPVDALLATDAQPKLFSYSALLGGSRTLVGVKDGTAAMSAFGKVPIAADPGLLVIPQF